MGVQIGMRRSCRQLCRPLFRRQPLVRRTDKIDVTGERQPVDDDLNHIVIAQLADGSARQRFRGDVAEAGAGRHAGETGIGDQRHRLPHETCFSAEVS